MYLKDEENESKDIECKKYKQYEQTYTFGR